MGLFDAGNRGMYTLGLLYMPIYKHIYTICIYMPKKLYSGLGD